MFDVIVIGSGISGLNFALRAAENHQRVLVVTKKKVAQSSTNFAQGGIAAVLSKLDDYGQHIQDTLTAGCFHNNRRAVEYMVRHGPSAVARLMELGVPFATHDGKLLLTREGGHRKRRIAFVADATGQAIEKTLVEKVRRHPSITLMEHAFAAELLVRRRCCFGIRILKDKMFQNIFAQRTVIATGGIGQLYENTTNPAISTGDGLAMAARAGCGLRDMEFVQFHPTALKLPGKPRLLISEAVRGEGAYLRNAKGQHFMKKLHPLGELAPRDIVSRAIFEEEKTGPVFLDLRHKNSKEIKTRFPHIHRMLHAHGLDITKDLIPVSPAAHYLCGGIRVNLRGETGIKNLFAFGEAAGTGVHGANRLASNSLLEALVFSDRILQAPRSKPFTAPRFALPKLHRLTESQRTKLKKITRGLKDAMWEHVGIVRSTKSLARAQAETARFRREFEKLPGHSRETLELGNMLIVSRLIIKAASLRRKSLGCHFRKD